MNAVEAWNQYTNGDSVSVAGLVNRGDILARELEQVVKACEVCNDRPKESPKGDSENG